MLLRVKLNILPYKMTKEKKIRHIRKYKLKTNFRKLWFVDIEAMMVDNIHRFVILGYLSGNTKKNLIRIIKIIENCKEGAQFI